MWAYVYSTVVQQRKYSFLELPDILLISNFSLLPSFTATFRDEAEDDLSELQSEAVPEEVRKWLASTFAKQASPLNAMQNVMKWVLKNPLTAIVWREKVFVNS